MPSKQIEQAWALLARGDAAAAADRFAAVTGQFPANAEAHAGHGHALLRLGRDDAAKAALERAVALSPELAQAWRDLGLTAMRRYDYLRAEETVRRSVTLNPQDANAWFLLAQALFALNRFADAEASFARAAALHPSFTEARFKLGNLAFDKKAYPAASRHYAAFVSARPTDLNGWINYGLSLASAGELGDARAALERAVALAPGQVKPLALLASVLRQGGAPSNELAPITRRVLELSPESVDMRVQLACCLFDENNFGEAHANLERALALDPQNLTAQWLRLQMPRAVVAADEAERVAFLRRWREGMERFDAIDWTTPGFAEQAETTITAAANFYLAYLGQPLLAEQARNAAVLRRMALAAYGNRGEPEVCRIGNGRRRIAVFSSSLHAHSVSRVWSSTLLALDPQEFELGAFYAGDIDDVSTQMWRAGASHFESGRQSVSAWMDRLRAFAPDILIFPDIGMDRFVQAVASMRHAPVQATTWGHPVTSGMTATIDYFLGADACEPADADNHYAEVLMRLPRLGCYLEPSETSEGAAPIRDGVGVRLLCTQSADKLHPGHDALFARIVAAAPAARLDILCSTLTAHVADALAARMRAEFSRHDVDFDARCRVHPRLPVERYYEFIERADLCLDSLDFSGGVTSLDALWRSTPIVTLPGALMRGRQTYGMLKLLGLDELVASSLDDYVAIAARLAGDAAARDALSGRIRAGKHSLYRDTSAVTALADFLRTVQPPALRPEASIWRT